MATGQSECMSDEIFNFKCTPCLKLNKSKEAVKYCVECQGYCCQSCVDMHKVVPALMNHTLLDKSSFKTTSSSKDLPEVPTERCDRHQTNLVNMYCGNHDVVGCHTCMGLDHRTCVDVQSIPDCIDTLFQKSDLEKEYRNIHDTELGMDKRKKIRQSLLQTLNESKIEAVDAVRCVRSEMESILDNLEKESINEIENEHRRRESILKKEEIKADNEVEYLTASEDNLQKSEGNKAQQFVCLKIAQKTRVQTEDVSISLETPIDATITFFEDRSIRDFLHSLKTFGSLKQNAFASLNPKTTVYTVKSTRDLNVKIQNDKSVCSVWGSCLTEDGSLLLADQRNKKLKRADIVRMSVVDYCDLPTNLDGPYGVCCANKQEAAVTYGTDTIQFVSLGNQMTLTRQMKLGHNCFGIAYKNDRLYVTDNGTSLYIHDISGNLLESMTQDSSGNGVFQNSRYITFSDIGDRVVVADWSNGLITFYQNGKYAYKFSCNDLSSVNGVCSDLRGNLFVCGYSSGNVLQITQNESKMLGVVVPKSGGIGSPISVCFDSRKCTLVVTSEATDRVKLFELQ